VTDYEKPNLIDGFTSVQAVRRSGDTPSGPRFRPSRTTLPGMEKMNAGEEGIRKPGGRIGHTVLPVKHEVECYECGYPFKLPGHLYDTFCPKCHKPLVMTRCIIDGECTGITKTIGTIEIKKEGILKDAELIGGDVILAGNAKEGTIHATRRLELCAGAEFDFVGIRTKDLFIRRGGKFVVSGKIFCRNLEVEGKLRSRIFSAGTVIIRSGGYLLGEVRGPHLIVENGGGLKAKISVGINADPAG